jgi:predicted transcriptional regulator of viral defense system
MRTINTLLSSKDSALIEQVILHHGQIVTSAQLEQVFKEGYSSKGDRLRRISLLAKAGWLVRIKRGLYLVVAELSALGIGNTSHLLISNALNSESYISFASALNFHGMFDQLTKTVDSITCKTARNYRFQTMEFRFFKIKKELYFGFTQERVEGKLVNIAEKEKVILDYLYLRKNAAALSLILEKLREHKSDLNFSKMVDYAKAYNLTTIRTLGFLSDTIGVSSDALYETADKNMKGFSRMHAQAKTFNAKWRLYYDPRIIE